MSEKEFIPINKGHFTLDTPERVKAFQEKMAFGWDKGKYREYRDAWENYPTQKTVADYPVQIDLELSSKCNLHCPMCYTKTQLFTKNVEKRFMDMELYKKIIDEVAGKVCAVRLSWRGESSLHPHFVEAIQYAKDKEIREVSFLTNCSTFNLEFFKKVVDAGADWISISIDGMGETYNKIRNPLIFEETFQKIRDIKRHKEENNLVKPTIKIQTIWPAIRNNPEEYYNTFSSYVDLIAFNPLIDYLGKDQNIVYEENFSCPQLYERLFVGSDGNVMMCNSDEFNENVIGNAYEESILDIWHGENLTKVRQIHNKANGFKELEMCRRCFYPRKTEVNETATINGRKILIENYINRRQVIGE